MIEWLMLCTIGFLAGCLLTLSLFPLVHERAVRLTTRRMTDAMPLAMAEIRADKDHLRAQFAMAIRRLEVNIDELKTKSTEQLAEIGRKHAEIRDLKTELDRRAALIFALRARWRVRQATVRRIVTVLLYVFIRSGRRRKAALFTPRSIAGTVHSPQASIVGR